MITFKQGVDIAKEVGMAFDPPFYAFELNAHTFRTGEMDERCCWIDHTFYLAESTEDCIKRKLAAIADSK